MSGSVDGGGASNTGGRLCIPAPRSSGRKGPASGLEAGRRLAPLKQEPEPEILGWGPRTCISNRFPELQVLLSWGPHF